MIETLGQIGACLSDPWGCVVANFIGWLEGFTAVELAAWCLGLGMVFGALLGWRGLVILATGGVAVFVLNRGKADSSKEDDIYPDPDKRPSPYETPKVRKRDKPRVRTLQDLFKR